MKIQLTETAKQELKALYVELDKLDDPDYHRLKLRDRLLLDADLYIEDAYEKNSFKHLDDWCRLTGEGEYQKNHLMNVKKKIGKMLIEDIITIVG